MTNQLTSNQAISNKLISNPTISNQTMTTQTMTNQFPVKSCQSNLLSKQSSFPRGQDECPLCHFVFTPNGNVNNIINCPSCHRKFKLGTAIDHGKGCAVCHMRYHGANNVYFRDGCPAIMDDARFITYYNSTNELTEAMRKMNGFKSSNQFRTFMQTNADLFMESEREYQIRENTCAPTVACSEGWYDLWTKKDGDWTTDNACTYPLNH